MAILDKISEIRHQSKLTGDAADATARATKAVAEAGAKTVGAIGWVVGKLGLGTVKGADRTAGYFVEKTANAGENKVGKYVAFAFLAGLAWKLVPKIWHRHKAKQELKHEQIENSRLTLAEQNYAKRTTYASQENNPLAQMGHENRLAASRSQGLTGP